MMNKTLIYSLLSLALLGSSFLSTASNSPNARADGSSVAFPEVRHAFETVDGLKIFYREAGRPEQPTIVLLHGFPSSSHMYRNLIRDLSDAYHVMAPDYPGFGESDFPSPLDYEYSFDNIARTMDRFLEQKGLDRYSLYIQDYGAPIGFRIATAHPERVQALLVQNGNAYEEGVSESGWEPIERYQKEKSAANEVRIINEVFSLEAMKWQYTHGTRNPDSIAPENWLLDYMRISRPGQHQVQLALFYDYQNNIKLYPTWQAYLRKHQPPVLVTWGKNDAFFPVAGAEGYRRDLKDIDYNILDTGHFALEEEGPFIAKKIRDFLAKRGIK